MSTLHEDYLPHGCSGQGSNWYGGQGGMQGPQDQFSIVREKNGMNELTDSRQQ